MLFERLSAGSVEPHDSEGDAGAGSPFEGPQIWVGTFQTNQALKWRLGEKNRSNRGGEC